MSGDTLERGRKLRKIPCWWSVVRYLTMNTPVACARANQLMTLTEARGELYKGSAFGNARSNRVSLVTWHLLAPYQQNGRQPARVYRIRAKTAAARLDR